MWGHPNDVDGGSGLTSLAALSESPAPAGKIYRKIKSGMMNDDRTSHVGGPSRKWTAPTLDYGTDDRS